MVASRSPNFRDHVWGGHLDEQMRGAALPADAKAAIEKQVNEFHLERMNASGKVTVWFIGQRLPDAIL